MFVHVWSLTSFIFCPVYKYQVPEWVSRVEPLVAVSPGPTWVLDDPVSNSTSGAGDRQRPPLCLSGEFVMQQKWTAHQITTSKWWIPTYLTAIFVSFRSFPKRWMLSRLCVHLCWAQATNFCDWKESTQLVSGQHWAKSTLIGPSCWLVFL